jgi:hypothetical protein
MPAELLKCGGDEVARLIHKLIMDIWEKEYVPKEWRKSIICPRTEKEWRKCRNEFDLVVGKVDSIQQYEKRVSFRLTLVGYSCQST